MGFLNPDNFLNRFFGKVGDVITLNILFILCSIPLFTIGASATALYYASMKMIKGDETIARKDFIKSFKENFKQSTIVWMVFVVIAVILIFNIQFLVTQESSYGNMLKYLSYGISAIVVFELLYIFPVIGAFANTTKNLLKNAFLFTYMHIPSTLVMALLWVIPLSLTFTDLKLAPLYLFCWFFFGFALLALICSWFLYRIFKKYLPAEEEETETAAHM